MFVQVAAASGLAQSLLEACINHHSATAMDLLKMVSRAAMCISTWCSLRVAAPSAASAFSQLLRACSWGVSTAACARCWPSLLHPASLYC
jgi:hypothetical protein